VTTKITIEEPGRPPVTIDAECYAVVHVRRDGNAFEAGVVLPDGHDRDMAEMLTVGVMEYAGGVADRYAETQHGKLLGFIHRMAMRLTGELQKQKKAE
jgi:hypothetical protein